MSDKAVLTEKQIDAIGEIGNISMSSAATAMHDIISRKVIITTPDVTVMSVGELTNLYNAPFIIVDVCFTSGVEGKNILIMKTDDAKLITSILLDQEYNPEEELSEMHLSAMGEVMNQMMGSASTALSTLISTPVHISPPNVSVVNIAEDREKLDTKYDKMISVKFKLHIENLLDTEIVQLMPVNFGVDLVNSFFEANKAKEKAVKAEQTKSNTNKDSEDNLIKQADVKKGIVRDVQLQSFDNEEEVKNGIDNLDLLLDVPLQVTVELGRTKKMLKDILELNLGSIISLEKAAGDLIDVFVNGKLLAKGEVVVIDDNFGIRITDIVSSIKKI